MFNQKLTTRMRSQTCIGYLPILIAPAHEFDTLNTVAKRCLAISARFGQEHIVINVDQALYCKLMELKWTIPEYLDKVIPCLGGLHILMNFLWVITWKVPACQRYGWRVGYLHQVLLSLYSMEKHIRRI